MFVTARQLELILKMHGKVVLPYRARLTPAAKDWLHLKKLSIEYTDINEPQSREDKASRPAGAAGKTGVYTGPGRFLWWADTQNGTASAAIAMVCREDKLFAMQAAHATVPVLGAIRELANQFKSGAAGGVFVVAHSDQAMVLANRSPVIRAVVASTLPALDQAITDVAANLLIIEAGKLPLMQMRTLISRFVKATRTLGPQMTRALSEAAACV